METQTLNTTDHDVIRDWTASRGGLPARWSPEVVTAHQYSILIAFPQDQSLLKLQASQISWEEWFSMFERAQLSFTYAAADPEDRYYRLVSRQQPQDPHLQAPAEANRDKHIDFLDIEEGGEG